jgi:RND family efflux transporter MFP subunit
MTLSLPLGSRVLLPVAGLIVTSGLVWQSSHASSRLRDWMPPPQPSAVRDPGSPRPSRVVAEGRVVAYPGAEVVVGTEVAGLVLKVAVEEKAVVRQGDLLAELNAADLRASRAEAIARIAEAEADIQFAERELARDRALLVRNAGTPQNVDTNRRALDAARARRAAAAATRERFDALIAKTQITAPIAGVVTARVVHPGETVDAGAPVVTIANLDRLRIEAEVDEFDTALVALGAPVAITAEGYGAAVWPGRVEEVPDAVVARRLRPEDPGRPIDSRVLPVKIAFQARAPLKLGQRVEVAIDSVLHEPGAVKGQAR